MKIIDQQIKKIVLHAMIGPGQHRTNGINLPVCFHLIRVYVIPRLVYGLNVIWLTTKDIALLTTFHMKLVKQIQHLPDRASDVVSYLLLDKIPVEAELIHKCTLTIFGAEVQSASSMTVLNQFDGANQQLNEFLQISLLLEKYNQPNPHNLLEMPPRKHTWNRIVYDPVNDF